MKTKIVIILIFQIGSRLCYGQADSILAPANLNFPDEVFLTYTDFRYNKGISVEQIISPIKKDQLDFLIKTIETETLTYMEGQKTSTVTSNTIWGFFQNKTLYINFRGDFYRVPVFGSICYLVATVEVYGSGFYDPMFGPGFNSRRQEVREFLINFYDGVVKEFKMEDAELLLSRDKTLFEEYKKLNRRNQREQIFRYIRKYNETHPIYFLK